MKYRVELPKTQYGTILADPPWLLKTPGVRRELHYDRMTTDDIKAIPVADIALPDAHLWLWTTNPHLPEALEVVAAWGFEYKSLLTWAKNRMGTGWWLRSKTEHLIFAARSKRLRKNPGNITTLVQAAYEGHSVKPQCFYDIIERLSPAPRVVLFSRQERPGWTTLVSNASAPEPYGDTT